MEDYDKEHEVRIFTLFSELNYEECVKVAESRKRASLTVLQVFMIALQRLHGERAAPVFEERLAKIEHLPWELAATSMLVGLREPAAVRGLAKSPTELAEFHFLLGSRRLTEGRVAEARQEFEACMKVAPKELASGLAKLWLEVPSQAPLPADARAAIEDLMRACKGHAEGERWPDAYASALGALTAIDRHHGCTAVLRAQILVMLIGSAWQARKFEEAISHATAAFAYVEALRVGEAAERVVEVCETIGEIASLKGEWRLAHKAYMRAGALRVRNAWGGEKALLPYAMALSKASAELGDNNDAIHHLINAIRVASKQVHDGDEILGFLGKALPLFLHLGGKGDALFALAGMIESVEVKVGEEGFGKTRYKITASCLHLWPEADAQARASLTRSLLKCAQSDETAPAAQQAHRLKLFMAFARTLPADKVKAEAILEAYEAVCRETCAGEDELRLNASLMRLGADSALSETTLATFAKALVSARKSQQAANAERAAVILGQDWRRQARAANAVKLADVLIQGDASNVVAAKACALKAHCLYDLGNDAAAYTEARRGWDALQREGAPDPDVESELLSALSVTAPDLENKRSWCEKAYHAAQREGVDVRARYSALYNLAHLRCRLREFDQVLNEIEAALASSADETDNDGPAMLRTVGAEAALGAHRFDLATRWLDEIDASGETPDSSVAANMDLLRAHARAGAGDWHGALAAAVAFVGWRTKNAAEVLRYSSDVERRRFLAGAEGAHQVLLSIVCEGEGFSGAELADVWCALQTRNTMTGEGLLAEQTIEPASEQTKNFVSELREVQSAILAIQLTGETSSKAAPKTKGVAQTKFAKGMRHTKRSRRSLRAFDQLSQLKQRRAELQREVRQAPEYATVLAGLESNRVNSAQLSGSGAFECVQLMAFDALPATELHPTPEQKRSRVALFVKRAIGGGVELHRSPLMEAQPAPDWSADVQPSEAELDAAEKKHGEMLERAGEELMARALRSAASERARLVCIFDGAFQKLCVPGIADQTGTRVLDQYDLSFAPRLADAFAQPSRKTEPAKLNALVVGSPAFDAPKLLQSQGARLRAKRVRARQSDMELFFEEAAEFRGSFQFDPLPGTALEAHAVSRVAKGARLVMGAKATLDVVRNMGEARIVHLATHGFYIPSQHDTGETERLLGDLVMHVDPREIRDGALSPTRLDNPLHRSGLALAGANDFLETSRSHPRFGLGLLLAANIAELDLRRIELLFLSACETGRGAKRVGEGIAGLQQAFLASGVQALVVSIWSIPDMVTCLLVTEFYRRLGEGETIERALTLAQTHVRELTAERYNDEVRTLSKRYGVNPRGSLSYAAPTKHPFEHPSWWGGFRCVGDTGRSISLRRTKSN